jgi:hypothetical protein
MAKDKARYFTFLLYPESIPEDWEMKLESIGLPIAISPLHDKDLSDVEGQKYKKAHYHVRQESKVGVTNFGFQPFQCVVSFRQERVVFF